MSCTSPGVVKEPCSQRLRLAAVLDFEKRRPRTEAQLQTAAQITKNVEICTSAGY